MRRRTLRCGASRPATGSAELSRLWGTPVRSFGSLGFGPKRRPIGRAVARAFVVTVALGGAVARAFVVPVAVGGAFASVAAADDGSCASGPGRGGAACAAAAAGAGGA